MVAMFKHRGGGLSRSEYRGVYFYRKFRIEMLENIMGRDASKNGNFRVGIPGDPPLLTTTTGVEIAFSS